MSSEIITRNDNCVVSIALGKYKMLLSLELVRIRSANGRIRIPVVSALGRDHGPLSSQDLHIQGL